MAEMAVSDECAKNVQNNPASELRRVVVDVVMWGDFNDFHAGLEAAFQDRNAQPLVSRGVGEVEAVVTRTTKVRVGEKCPRLVAELLTHDAFCKRQKRIELDGLSRKG
jgi:hypothetical protein